MVKPGENNFIYQDISQEAWPKNWTTANQLPKMENLGNSRDFI